MANASAASPHENRCVCPHGSDPAYRTNTVYCHRLVAGAAKEPWKLSGQREAVADIGAKIVHHQSGSLACATNGMTCALTMAAAGDTAAVRFRRCVHFSTIAGGDFSSTKAGLGGGGDATANVCKHETHNGSGGPGRVSGDEAVFPAVPRWPADVDTTNMDVDGVIPRHGGKEWESMLRHMAAAVSSCKPSATGGAGKPPVTQDGVGISCGTTASPGLSLDEHMAAMRRCALAVCGKMGPIATVHALMCVPETVVADVSDEAAWVHAAHAAGVRYGVLADIVTTCVAAEPGGLRAPREFVPARAHGSTLFHAQPAALFAVILRHCIRHNIRMTGGEGRGAGLAADAAASVHLPPKAFASGLLPQMAVGDTAVFVAPLDKAFCPRTDEAGSGQGCLPTVAGVAASAAAGNARKRAADHDSAGGVASSFSSDSDGGADEGASWAHGRLAGGGGGSKRRALDFDAQAEAVEHVADSASASSGVPTPVMQHTPPRFPFQGGPAREISKPVPFTLQHVLAALAEFRRAVVDMVFDNAVRLATMVDVDCAVWQAHPACAAVPGESAQRLRAASPASVRQSVATKATSVAAAQDVLRGVGARSVHTDTTSKAEVDKAPTTESHATDKKRFACLSPATAKRVHAAADAVARATTNNLAGASHRSRDPLQVLVQHPHVRAGLNEWGADSVTALAVRDALLFLQGWAAYGYSCSKRLPDRELMAELLVTVAPDVSKTTRANMVARLLLSKSGATAAPGPQSEGPGISTPPRPGLSRGVMHASPAAHGVMRAMHALGEGGGEAVSVFGGSAGGRGGSCSTSVTPAGVVSGCTSVPSTPERGLDHCSQASAAATFGTPGRVSVNVCATTGTEDGDSSIGDRIHFA